jgi:predicted metal-dependent peptidase
MPEQQDKLNQLAHEVLILSRNTLLVNLRFLDAALSQFQLLPIETSSLLTDGQHILYNPKYVLERYQAERELPVRDYLHIVMHCIFRHMYMNPKLDRTNWDLACDIAVEHVISGLGLKAAAAKREQQQKEALQELQTKLGQITAERVYRYLTEQNIDPAKAASLRGLFYGDNHEIWYMTVMEITATFGISQEDGSQGDGRGSGQEQGQEEGQEGSARSAMEKTWKTISERMQMDLETFQKNRGDSAGNLLQNLTAVNREKYDYTAFLKKFAVMGETMRVNEDEFDYVYYTYGLKLYDKMPLIEPLEYKEVKRIREFVIAIDTSGSTSGELVQKFVQKTYNILKSTESFFAKINLHIIQCDAGIQEDAKITSQEEFDEYLKTMQVRGLGGTDFRPVFTYVDNLVKKKEFTNLKGLIYFTDGYGVFPAKMPDYDTAFVFVEDEYNNPNVPPWAIKLVLQKDEI